MLAFTLISDVFLVIYRLTTFIWGFGPATPLICPWLVKCSLSSWPYVCQSPDYSVWVAFIKSEIMNSASKILRFKFEFKGNKLVIKTLNMLPFKYLIKACL